MIERMKWMPIVVVLLILSPTMIVTLKGESMIIEPPPLDPSESTTLDPDNDGIVDSEDVLNDGNAIVILSIDTFLAGDNLSGACSPFFEIGIDENNDGQINETEAFITDYYPDQDYISGEGFGEGLLWHGVDLYDDLKNIIFLINAYNYISGSYDDIDICSDPDYFGISGTYEIYDQYGYYQEQNFSDNGEYDIDDFENGANIAFHLEIIKGTTIETATPEPSKKLNDLPETNITEGDYLTFSITNVFVPNCIEAPIGYEWYILNFNETAQGWSDEYYCVQKYYNESYEEDDLVPIENPETFTLYANYGSAGKYTLLCVLFSDLVEDYNLYWSDYEYWVINIEHKNTDPNAFINITPEEDISQLDKVSISGWRTYDEDQDELSYTWFINYEQVSTKIDFSYTFFNAGEHSIKLIVEDDENAVSIAYKNITVQNLDLSFAKNDCGPLIMGETYPFDSSYVQEVVLRETAQTSFDLLWGYSLGVSLSFVSYSKITHNGTLELIFNEETSQLSTFMDQTEDSFIIEYRPYFEFIIYIFDEDEYYIVYDVDIPIPLLSNVDGLDEDGLPLIDIPSFLGQNIDIYTWDLMKKIYQSNEPVENSFNSMELSQESVNIAQIDIFELIKVVLNVFPNQITLAIGKAIDIVEIFGKLFLEWNLNFKTMIKQSLYLIIDCAKDSFNRMIIISGIDIKTYFPAEEERLYYAMSVDITLDIGLSIDLHFQLTKMGQRIYGVVNEIAEKGLIIGIFDTIMTFFETGDVPLKQLDWKKTLWDLGTILKQNGNETYVYDGFDKYSDDLDEDGINNSVDDFKYDPMASKDTDHDGLPDELIGTSTTGLVEDIDDDNDTITDTMDDFSKDPGAWKDTDDDGKPDFINGTSTTGLTADEDIDNDGMNNSLDYYPEDPTRWVKEEETEEDSGLCCILIFMIGGIIIILIVVAIILLLIIKKKKRNLLKIVEKVPEDNQSNKESIGELDNANNKS